MQIAPATKLSRKEEGQGSEENKVSLGRLWLTLRKPLLRKIQRAPWPFYAVWNLINGSKLPVETAPKKSLHLFQEGDHLDCLTDRELYNDVTGKQQLRLLGGVVGVSSPKQ